MKQWVIDTNVVVSGLFTPDGKPAQIMDAIIAGRIQLVYDARILAEYRDILKRPRLKLNPCLIKAFLDGLRGQHLVTPHRINTTAPDPDDLIFIEAALASRDQTIITGDLAHFPRRIRHGVHVLTPAETVMALSDDGTN